MKAYDLTKFGDDAWTAVEKPEPRCGESQVKIRVRACSLNFRDLLMSKGLYDPRMKLPVVPLSDGAGEVVEAGSNVRRLKTGDRVSVNFFPEWHEGEVSLPRVYRALGGSAGGMLAQMVVAEEGSCVKVPAHLSFEEAATLPCAALTAWNALFEAGAVRAGQSVLVQGTGGVSLFALQLAKLAGARVILTSSSDEKLARAKQLGADELINYKTTPDWEKRAIELTGGTGVDHVVEVGGSGTLPRSVRACRIGGTISLIGVLAGVGEFNPLPLVMRAIRVNGIYVGSRAMFESMNRAIELHKLKPVVDRVFEFDQARDALQHMAGASHFGKIVIRV